MVGSTLCAVGLAKPQAAQGTPPAAPLDFNRDVRPILSDNCFACHGPDPEKRKGKLRLDDRAAALAPAEGGHAAIVPGKPDESELVKRIVTADADEKMPPAKSHKTLTPAQVATLKRWVAEGASYAGHWAFTPPVKAPLPDVSDATWARNPIDRFVLARLDREGLKPNAEADRTTLIRRLHLDLTGLPPTPEEVDAFVADDSPDAYEKLVDRLLASPHYGERWGRHWLDAARYADSDGYEKDKPRHIYFYRDWVIGAFNRDLPYDRFLTEQLAGDLLPNATQDQIVATGFLRNSMINEEGGVDPEQFRMDAMFDRMDALGKGVLGLTIQCAQCHTHKFDPVTQEEYYRLFAFLNNDHEAYRVVYSPDEQAKAADLLGRMRQAEDDLRHRAPDWAERMAAWEKAVKAEPQPAWTPLALDNQGDNAQRYIPQPDGSYLAQGYAPTKFTATFKTTVADGTAALRVEYLPDPNLPAGGPGRSLFGTCALSEFTVEVEANGKRQKVKVVGATSDYDQPERELEPNFFDKTKDRRVTGPVRLAIDGDKNTAWGIDAGPGRRNVARKAVFRLEKPINGGGKPVTVYIGLQQNHGGWNSDDLMTNNLGRFRVSATADRNAKADPLPMRVREILATSAEKRTDRQQAEVFAYWRTTVREFKDANDRIEALWKQWPAGATTMTLAARDAMRPTAVLDRGDWLKPKKTVEPGVPSFLNPLPADAPPNRLALAKWLVDPKAPTTARVMVNRVWQAYFGLGLVSTSEDFGVQGEPPSHPELLDWLAVEFMEGGDRNGARPSAAASADANGRSTNARAAEDGRAPSNAPWSVKRLHRLIVTSATYRQASTVTPALLARDPYNRLLARGARFRVEGEIVRDISLAAGGLLNPKLGGRSVMPPAPAFLFQPPTSYAPFPWKDETDAEKYRRGVYTYRRRSTPYPVLQTFDVPNAETACVRRLRSNSPLQALAALNEPIFVECAVGLARRAIAEAAPTPEARITRAFRRAVARPPTADELATLLGLYTRQKARFDKGELKAEDLLAGAGVEVKDLPSGTDVKELAAEAVVARVILNLDETITRE
ncbi:MAG TPA: PSD1 and planctomycete cytochrome C domain-containing protein [Humisphaera sp.]